MFSSSNDQFDFIIFSFVVMFDVVWKSLFRLKCPESRVFFVC